MVRTSFFLSFFFTIKTKWRVVAAVDVVVVAQSSEVLSVLFMDFENLSKARGPQFKCYYFFSVCFSNRGIWTLKIQIKELMEKMVK